MFINILISFWISSTILAYIIILMMLFDLYKKIKQKYKIPTNKVKWYIPFINLIKILLVCSIPFMNILISVGILYFIDVDEIYDKIAVKAGCRLLDKAGDD